MGSGSNGQRSDEDDFVKVDDLPLQLTVMCEVCVCHTVNRTFMWPLGLMVCLV